MGLFHKGKDLDVGKKINWLHMHQDDENEILMHFRKNSKNLCILDDPINIDWDGNELKII